jgi:hypothetical protein
MSFLNSNNGEYLSARITQKGRKAIAKGNFKIDYFQIGDSEFDYTTSLTNQKVFSPFDKEGGVKYPFKYESSTSSTTYGNPISNYLEPVPLRNSMSPAGFVSQYDIFGTSTKVLTPITGTTFTETYSGTTIETLIGSIPFSGLTGTNQITFTKNSGINLNQTGYTTLVFDTFPTGYTLNNKNEKIVKNYIPTGKTNSLVYRYSGGTATTGTTQTITLDRNVPNFALMAGLSGNVRILSNNYLPELTDSFNLDPWTMNIVWDNSIIGAISDDESITGYTSNIYQSTKQFLGYTTSSGQTFVTAQGLSSTGFTITGTSFANSMSTGSTDGDDIIMVTPEDQRTVAIIHYSELGDIDINPERFFKYDDYISTSTSTGSTVTSDDSSDLDYFEVFIPFILYHRSPGTIGATFTIDTTSYYIKSNVTTTKQALEYRYLLDVNGYKVGKVFINNKVIVFDDQELVAVLDYRSNRKYTLPSPRVYATPTNSTATNSMLTGTTGQTVWVTYMLEYTGNTKLNSLPCNYFNKVRLGSATDGCTSSTPSNISFKFGDSTISELGFLKTNTTGITEGFIANKFTALVQIVNSATGTPISSEWRKIDLTSEVGGDGSSLIGVSGFTGKTFTITKTQYDAASSNKFDLETHLNDLQSNYLGDTNSTTQSQFGDEQPFPGSIKLVRASDIEQMNFLINLPTGTFGDIPNNERGISQNPTYPTTGTTSTYITEVALLNSNKEPLVIAKTPTPIKRAGTQVFAVKLDF